MGIWNRLFLLFGILVCMALMAKDCKKKENEKFNIQIIQGDDKFSVKDSIAKLEKAPFKIKLFLYDHDGVYANISREPSYYELGKDEKPKDLQEIPAKVMVEENFNKDKDVFLTPEYFHYWSDYPDKDWHRVDKGSIQRKGDLVTATVTVKKFSLKNSDKMLPVKEIQNPVYFFFMATNKGENKPLKTLQREKLVINWQ